jgi:hypothetical protein
MTITSSDVSEYNTALADVEAYAQEAAGFLAASVNTQLTSSADNWANSNNVRVDQTATATYNAANDRLVMTFMSNQNNNAYGTLTMNGYMRGDFKTVEDIYNAGIAYGG